MNNAALITGASAGIGAELAREFAAHGHSLILSARNESALNALAAELRRDHKIEVATVVQDLARPGAAQTLFDQLRGTQVSILVNNAGFGQYGLFGQSDLQVQIEIIQVNVTALVQLTYLFLQPMLAAGRGRILNVASIAAFQPGPKFSIYYASKALVHSFTYALAHELRNTGVSVTSLCPGPTETKFFDKARIRNRQGLPMMDARAVARSGYRGLMKGRRVVIPGTFNFLLALLARHSPTRLSAAVASKIHRPR